jgi:exopolyphosphatase/guanosine-5'-triphosphate,3'-diphosphate pyrophosphatase
MRIAAIDIGTNSIHMVIAQATGPASFEVVEREREVVQIGRGSFVNGRLGARAIQRTVSALSRFVRLARRSAVDRIVCTATAAVREASNGGDFLAAAREAAGVTPRVIPAEEEGRFVYLAVKSALQLDDSPSLIVDIGGGSVQLVVGRRDRLLLAASAPLGALRLTEQLAVSESPAGRELNRLRRHIDRTAREALGAVKELAPARAYGSSGAIHALAQVLAWMRTGQGIEHLNGHVLSLDMIRWLGRQLARMSTAQRERLPGLDAKRAGIIVPGALVLEHILEDVGLDAITLSDFGVREGLVTDFVQRHGAEIRALEPIEDLKLRSVTALLNKFGDDRRHPEQVARLALSMFDQLRSVHELGDEARPLLHCAALLHDVGSAISYDGHAAHSAYVIKNGNLRGLTAQEVEMIAIVARYHSKSRPRRRDLEYLALPKSRRRMVRWLAALLQIAEGLDRSHYQLIRDVRVRRRGNRLTLRVSARRDAQLELWAARRRTALLTRLLAGRARKGSGPVAVRVEVEKARLRGRVQPSADSSPDREPRSRAVPAPGAAASLRVVRR